MNKLQETIKTAINKMVTVEPREWPPTCMLISYQPVRPEVDIDEEVQKDAQ